MFTRLMTITAFALAASAFAATAATAQDAAAGEKVFKRCAMCHAVGEGAANKLGPELNGLIGRKIAGVDGYSYSDGLKAFGEGKTWDEATLDKWLEAPKSLVADTKMSYAGVKNPDERKNLEAYLATFGPDGAKK